MLIRFTDLLGPVCTLLAALLLQGCADNGDVLATVNGEAITRADLDQMLERMLGGSTDSMSPEAEQKALESLVMMRAIAQRQEQAIDEEELDAIESRVRRYREELLVEAYLRAHAKPYIPTEAEIAGYYAGHPELFGGAPVRVYEILQSRSELNAEQAARLLQSFAQASRQRDWRAYAVQLKQQGHPVVYVQGRSDGPAISPRLMQVIGGLSANEVSDVFYLDKKPHLLRVTAIEMQAPRPLDAVRAEIRNTLAMAHIRDSIKEIGQEALAASDIEYKNAPREAATGSANEADAGSGNGN